MYISPSFQSCMHSDNFSNALILSRSKQLFLLLFFIRNILLFVLHRFDSLCFCYLLKLILYFLLFSNTTSSAVYLLVVPCRCIINAYILPASLLFLVYYLTRGLAPVVGNYLVIIFIHLCYTSCIFSHFFSSEFSNFSRSDSSIYRSNAMLSFVHLR